MNKFKSFIFSILLTAPGVLFAGMNCTESFEASIDGILVGGTLTVNGKTEPTRTVTVDFVKIADAVTKELLPGPSNDGRWAYWLSLDPTDSFNREFIESARLAFNAKRRVFVLLEMTPKYCEKKAEGNSNVYISESYVKRPLALSLRQR